MIRDRVEAVSGRGRAWADGQDPGSFRGVAIGAWRRYRAIDGPLQLALLSLYFLVAILPALLVMEEFLDSHPRTLADHLVHHYGLSEETATLLRSVLVQSRAHELSSGVLAIAAALFFGSGSTACCSSCTCERGASSCRGGRATRRATRQSCWACTG